ncbi:MAG: YbcC family protein [Bacteroidota bacterium]
MNTNKTNIEFNEHDVIHELKHYLPAQAPLKDFIHHNTLHAFQHLKFDHAIRKASKMFGYQVSLSLSEFRSLYQSKRIIHENLEKIIIEKKGKEKLQLWLDRLLLKEYDESNHSIIGNLRAHWRTQYHINIDSITHPKIFRILCSYLDQGISIWKFPVHEKGFLSSLREIEKKSLSSLFKTKRARKLFLKTSCDIKDLLKILVGEEHLYKQYIFDQQFAHQGWSGMTSSIEDHPETLLDPKKISIQELIIFESLLEIDALDYAFGENWAPLATKLNEVPRNLFLDDEPTELNEVLFIFQNAFEWSYYDGVLSGINLMKKETHETHQKSFQALFCIDDRECSIRRYIEDNDKHCETFGTPGFFGVEFYFKPEHGKFYSKLCPAPVTPKYLIKEIDTKNIRRKDVHFTNHSHSLLGGSIISQTLGFWSAFKLFQNIFKPTMSPSTASSFNHMDQFSKLTIENTDLNDKENNLQIGFTIQEMADRVEALLKSIGLINDFAPIVYLIGHGSSSVNNPHYAGYDCGACSGRTGSVNARVMSFMANKKEVRALLLQRGISIPEKTQFLGGLHDTSRDDISFFDENSLSTLNADDHKKNEKVFHKALDSNAKERSRRLVSIDTTLSAKQIHEKIRTRSVSIFEPRPELNHATNALCIVGGRDFTKHLFLDRRSFMNSYNYKIDLDGKLLTNIMKPLGPVCGGINLEYFFSRVDNQKLGAGTKLPHNVMGLFGVANGIDGDLRPGLPSQMIEVHDSLRLLIIVEHFPEVVLNTIKSVDAMYEWFMNEWIHLVAINPETKEQFVFKEGEFKKYEVIKQPIKKIDDINLVIESSQENLPVYLIK